MVERDTASKGGSAVAHVADDGRVESVATHVREVAEMASEFAQSFGGERWAYALGMAHDIGKCSAAFQHRILDGGPRCDHSTAGAFELHEQKHADLLAYCAAGHHGGLPDGGTPAGVGDSTLLERLRKARDGGIPCYDNYNEGINIPDLGPLTFKSDVSQDRFSLTFATRMLFSCLVDADFLCTERFMQGIERRALSAGSLKVLASRLEERIQGFYPPSTELNSIRCEILDACMQKAHCEPGVFSLTAFTGGGKTLASLRFALNHACSGGRGMRRVIYAIPYTSIIEQNAAVFREVLEGDSVLEHHASFDFDDDGEDGNRFRLATENWDAPVVVTTNVQFFESLFSNKTSKCRKLHNIAGSVIVLDEAQMLPTKQLLPCVRALSELVHRYGCTVVLCTATQPSLDGLFEKYGCKVREIMPDAASLYERLKRVHYRYVGLLDDEELSAHLAECDQVLCVVNSRKQARRVFDLMKEKRDGEVYHLSTLMHASHRARILALVRDALREGRSCCVISTSLIEAGVDVDFPVVYRALAGIDSLVQCAGRCNREGKKIASDSPVVLFEPGTHYAIPSDIEQKIALTRSILSASLGEHASSLECSGEGVLCDVGSIDVVKSYFSQLHELRGERLDADGVLEALTSFPIYSSLRRFPSIPFKSAAEKFHMIEDGSYSVIVPDPTIEPELRMMREGAPAIWASRRLSRYSVGLYDQDIRELLRSGAIALLHGDVYELLDGSLYREDVGLDVADAGGKGLFF